MIATGLSSLPFSSGFVIDTSLSCLFCTISVFEIFCLTPQLTHVTVSLNFTWTPPHLTHGSLMREPPFRISAAAFFISASLSVGSLGSADIVYRNLLFGCLYNFCFLWQNC